VIFDFGMSVGLFTTIAGLEKKNWRGVFSLLENIGEGLSSPLQSLTY